MKDQIEVETFNELKTLYLERQQTGETLSVFEVAVAFGKLDDLSIAQHYIWGEQLSLMWGFEVILNRSPNGRVNVC